MEVSEAKKLRELERENSELKKALCQLDLRGSKLPDDLLCGVALPAH